MQDDAVSTSDDRQPYHLVDGKIVTQSEWKERLRYATELFDAFKHQVYLDGTL
jgi:hypothetical protein